MLDASLNINQSTPIVESSSFSKGAKPEFSVSRVSNLPNVLSRIGSHVTSRSNLESIMHGGLDPTHGGTGGASDAMPYFKRACQGKVHFGINVECPKGGEAGNFYSKFFSQPVELNIALREDLVFKEDLDDGNQGIYFTREKINPDEIIPMRLRTAFRKEGDIGADYSPSAFVKAIDPSESRSELEKIENIRKAIWGEDEYARTLEALVFYGDTESLNTIVKTMDEACSAMALAIDAGKPEVVKYLFEKWEGIAKEEQT
ncbi:hypothetical protein D3C77_454620 [compost metagenome]